MPEMLFPGPAGSLFLDPTSESEICGTFSCLNNSKALDINNLQIALIKPVIEHIASPLSHIFNLVLEQGVYPTAMKKSSVSVSYKTGDRNIPSNYRPISVVPIFSKGLEKIIFLRIAEFLDKNAILPDAQFALRKSRSTGNALLLLKETILKNIENNVFTLGLFIDFSKAFHLLDHRILDHKMAHYVIRGVPLSLLPSYLQGTTMCVYIGSNRSTYLPVPCGVPQASVLGPLLFNIYISDIINIDKSVKVIIYADDSSLLLSRSDPEALIKSCSNVRHKLHTRANYT